jgi:hypothetical protein
MNQFQTQSRLITIALLIAASCGIIYTASPTGIARGEPLPLHQYIVQFFPLDAGMGKPLCDNPGGYFPAEGSVPGYFEIDANVRAGNVVSMSFRAPGGVAFSQVGHYDFDYVSRDVRRVPAPAFSLPANTNFTVVVELYEHKKGKLLMRQKFKLNCTTREMTVNHITYH